MQLMHHIKVANKAVHNLVRKEEICKKIVCKYEVIAHDDYEELEEIINEYFQQESWCRHPPPNLKDLMQSGELKD